jgi:hypothetical protein
VADGAVKPQQAPTETNDSGASSAQNAGSSLQLLFFLIHIHPSSALNGVHAEIKSPFFGYNTEEIKEATLKSWQPKSSQKMAKGTRSGWLLWLLHRRGINTHIHTHSKGLLSALSVSARFTYSHLITGVK